MVPPTDGAPSRLTSLRASRTDTALRWLVAGQWLAVAWLADRNLVVDLHLSVVAQAVDHQTAPFERFAATWATPDGSLLLWSAIMTTALVATRPLVGPTGARWRFASASSNDGASAIRPRFVRAIASSDLARADAAVIVGILLLPHVTGLWGSTRLVPLDGAGLNPVLQHPLMLIHPPVLYAAQALVVAASRRPDRPRLRRFALAGLLTASMLGAWWAHDELGWGGWWAWDPVENSALAPMLALLAAIHARPMRAWRWSMAAVACVLGGVALTRSGLPTSVHGFSSDAPVAIPFAVLATVTAIAAIATPPCAHPVGGHLVAPARRFHRSMVEAATLYGLTVIGTAAVASVIVGIGNDGRIEGAVAGRLFLPVGLVAIIGLLVAGWRVSTTARLAHVGALMIIIGALWGAVDSPVWFAWVEPQPVGERNLGLLSVQVEHIEDQAIDARTAETRIDLVVARGDDESPRRLTIERYLDLGRNRARPSHRLGWVGSDTLVATAVDGDEVFLEYRLHRGLTLVWCGAVLVVIALIRRPVDVVSPPEHR